MKTFVAISGPPVHGTDGLPRSKQPAHPAWRVSWRNQVRHYSNGKTSQLALAFIFPYQLLHY